jgi:hypothetical protein
MLEDQGFQSQKSKKKSGHPTPLINWLKIKQRKNIIIISCSWLN